MFSTKDLFAKALGIEAPWFIDRMGFDPVGGKLDIWIDFKPGSLFRYVDPEKGIDGMFKAYDTTEKTWRHLNFFQHVCLLHARIPRVDIGDGKYRQVSPPWDGLAHGFTLLFEAFLLELAKVMPVNRIAKLCGLTNQKLWPMLRKYTELARQEADYSGVTQVGIDETAARKGHDYVTLFVDVQEHRTLYVTPGRDSETITSFCTDFQEHGGKPEQIEQVSCDMSPAFIKGVGNHLPEADIVFDRFHVTKVVNDAVDAIRKEEVRSNPVLKGAKYLFLKNWQNLTRKQRRRFQALRLSDMNLKTFRAYHIREAFQLVYEAKTPRMFERLLKQWYYWATHSRLPQMVKAAKTIRRHWQGVLSWASQRISNGILEGFNSIFQAAKSKARGYKKFETIRTIIYLLTGKLDFSKINPYCPTHTN